MKKHEVQIGDQLLVHGCLFVVSHLHIPMDKPAVLVVETAPELMEKQTPQEPKAGGSCSHYRGCVLDASCPLFDGCNKYNNKEKV